MGENTLMQSEAFRYIQPACVRGGMANVAIRADGDWRLCQSRLAGCNPKRGVIWCEYPDVVLNGTPVEIIEGQKLGFRFPSMDRRVSFVGDVRKVRVQDTDHGVRKVVEVSLPTSIVCENLRKSFRVQIEPEDAFEVVMWSTAMRDPLESDDMPKMHRGMIQDLSIGGAGVGGFDQEPEWEAGDHVGIQLLPPDEEEILLMGQVRRVGRTPEGMVTVGFAFIGAETPRKTFTAQEVISRLVNQFQRVQLERRCKSAS